MYESMKHSYKVIHLQRVAVRAIITKPELQPLSIAIGEREREEAATGPVVELNLAIPVGTLRNHRAH